MAKFDLHDVAMRTDAGAAATGWAKANAAGAQAGADHDASSALPAQASADWEVLIGAVADRLRQLGAAGLQSTRPTAESVTQFQVTVQECADDLSRLRTMLAHDLAQGRASDRARTGSAAAAAD